MLKWFGALGASMATGGAARASEGPAGDGGEKAYDVLVVGAGVFGVWTARCLKNAGFTVAVIDALEPAHSDASSGGESRVTRCGYGDWELYAEWAFRSLSEWQALSDSASLPLFHPTGVLWLYREGDALVEATAKTLGAMKIPFSVYSPADLRERFPVMRVADGDLGFFEPRGGGLMARRAVQTLAFQLIAEGVPFLKGTVEPIRAADAAAGALPHVVTKDGDRIRAEEFVFACGPWLDKVCPEAMAGRLFVTRQEIFYFAADPAVVGDFPVWAELPFYGLPSLEGRGFKVADDTHGPAVDPSTQDRRASEEGERKAREYLAHRFPALAENPLTETRVCQYENSSNGDLVIDRHPGLDNVWLAGCGSGHGFKHGPAIGAHLAGLIQGTEQPIERLSLASKKKRQSREVQ